MKTPLTYSESLRLAHAAGWDAGNRSMRKAGRKVWSRTDVRAAMNTFEIVMAATTPFRPQPAPQNPPLTASA